MVARHIDDARLGRSYISLGPIAPRRLGLKGNHHIGGNVASTGLRVAAHHREPLVVKVSGTPPGAHAIVAHCPGSIPHYPI